MGKRKKKKKKNRVEMSEGGDEMYDRCAAISEISHQQEGQSRLVDQSQGFWFQVVSPGKLHLEGGACLCSYASVSKKGILRQKVHP